MYPTFLLSAVLAFTVYGQLVIKMRAVVHAEKFAAVPTKLPYLLAMLTDFWVLSGLVAAFVAGICWMLAVERLELGFAYPFMALSFVLVPIASTFILGEALPSLQLLGLTFIVAGVTLSAIAR